MIPFINKKTASSYEKRTDCSIKKVCILLYWSEKHSHECTPQKTRKSTRKKGGISYPQSVSNLQNWDEETLKNIYTQIHKQTQSKEKLKAEHE